MGSPTFHPLPSRVDFPALEREVLDRWEDRKVFERCLEQTAGGPLWVFYEGPPTANGVPGAHHIEPRVFKDLFPRFKTMQGYHVPRKAGWDCHGLAVELAVEQELGLSGKPEIEKYGIAEFNAQCRESVLRHVDMWEQLTRRMAYWTDLSDPYRTMDAAYVQSVWWSLKQIYDKGLLFRDFRITPYCTRCGTGLSDHELGQPDVYQPVADPSVTVRFPLLSGPVADRYGSNEVDLLIWTTTPWTLVSNALVAVDPELTYAVARPRDGSARPVLIAEALVEKVLGDGWEVQDRFTGAELERSAYRRPFDLIDVPDGHFVALGDFVSVDEGTGLVHCSPTFGADDFALCRAYDVPMVNPIDLQGRFLPEIPMVGGTYFKRADPTLVDSLVERGLMFRHETAEHSYPHCWRCHTALIYYALPAWYVRTTAAKDALLRENA
ncbi:MAG: class I tRNA ligase family protein, partial [Streptosporangiales bacterium]